MALCFDSRRSTHDVDARISSGHGPVTLAARRIARREGLPESWLNEQATIYMPSTPDTHAPTVYDSPSLVVTGASAEHVLAMKLESGRAEDSRRHQDTGQASEADRVRRGRSDPPLDVPAGTNPTAGERSATGGCQRDHGLNEGAPAQRLRCAVIPGKMPVECPHSDPAAGVQSAGALPRLDDRQIHHACTSHCGIREALQPFHQLPGVRQR